MMPSFPPQGFGTQSYLAGTSILSYGADPLGVRDSTTAITNAIASLPATGGVIYVPAGMYLISSPITFDSTKTHVAIIGDSWGIATIKAKSNFTGNGMFIFNNQNLYITISSLLFDANAVANSCWYSDDAVVTGTRFIYPKWCKFQGGVNGQSLIHWKGNNVDGLFMDDCWIQPGNGVSGFFGDLAGPLNLLRRCFFECLTGGTAVRQDSGSLYLDSCLFAPGGAVSPAFYIDAGHAVGSGLEGNILSVKNCHFEVCPSGLQNDPIVVGNSSVGYKWNAFLMEGGWVGAAKTYDIKLNYIATGNAAEPNRGVARIAGVHFQNTAVPLTAHVFVAPSLVWNLIFEGNSVQDKTVTILSGPPVRGRVEYVDTSNVLHMDTWGLTPTIYKGITTAGMGFVPVYGATLQKSETAADTNVLTYTPPATAGSYRLHFVISVSAATAATLGWTATWKDSNGTAQAPTNLDLIKNGVAAPGLTFVAAAGDTYIGDTSIDIDNSATAIVCKLTFTGTSFTAKVSAFIEQLA